MRGRWSRQPRITGAERRAEQRGQKRRYGEGYKTRNRPNCLFFTSKKREKWGIGRPLKNWLFQCLTRARILEFVNSLGKTQILLHTLPPDCVSGARKRPGQFCKDGPKEGSRTRPFLWNGHRREMAVNLAPKFGWVARRFLRQASRQESLRSVLRRASAKEQEAPIRRIPKKRRSRSLTAIPRQLFSCAMVARRAGWVPFMCYTARIARVAIS
jgi:hypothetical protein